MNLKKLLASNIFLRKLIFPILRKFDFKIIIPHPRTFRPFLLKFWSHKGYWYYSDQIEQKEIKLFKKLISKGDNILEVGAHIGFITQIFEKLVSNTGKVLAIEPSPTNFKFLKFNTKKSTEKLQLALSDETKKGKFYIDNFGGFTNSLNKKLAEDRTKFFRELQSYREDSLTNINVNIETIDSVCKMKNLKPSFIKIDVEGAEYDVLKGAKETLIYVRSLMIEVTKGKNKKEIFDLLEGYRLIPINENCEFISISDTGNNTTNFFFMKR